MGTLRELTWLTQLGFSIVSPLLLCIIGSVWLREHYSLGNWIIFLGIFLGLGGAWSAGVSFYKSIAPKKEKKQEPPIAFNEHE